MEERIAEDEESLEYLYKEAWKKSQSKCSDTKECMAAVDLNVAPMVPHYILPGSEEERRWRQTHPKAKLVRVFVFSFYSTVTFSPLCLNISAMVIRISGFFHILQQLVSRTECTHRGIVG